MVNERAASPTVPSSDHEESTAGYAVETPHGDHAHGDHFIPIRKSDLVRLLTGHFAPEQQTTFREFCRLLEATLHYRHHCQFELLKDAYALFNPDAVTKDFANNVAADRDALATELITRSKDLMQSANYRRLTTEEIHQAIGTASEWGLRLDVDLDAFKQLEIWVRGSTTAHRIRRRWQNFNRAERVPVEIYQRLIVVFQLHEHDPSTTEDEVSHREALEDPVHFKLFKNIPREDVDMLLPGSRFRMSLLDRGKIVLPTVSGLVIAAMKVIKGTLLAIFAGFWGIIAFLGFAGGTIGYGLKSFFEYMRTKEKYQLNLTRSLYYQNLDNNAGVLFRLLDEAGEQEFREAIVAYWLLLHGPSEGMTARELDQQAEQWLSEMLEFHVDFEVHDALDKLLQLGCARQHNDRWQAEPLVTALHHLDHAWDQIFTHREAHQETTGLECEFI